jgi:hypothetical protein
MAPEHDLAARVDGLLHEPTQVHDRGVDLSVAAVHEVTVPGRIDFGGGELDPAGLEELPSTRRDPDDDYGWWDLDAGEYLLAYNESLTGDDPLVVQPRDELLERGASHPTLHTAALPRMPLSVGGAGLRIKENARVSTVVARDETL